MGGEEGLGVTTGQPNLYKQDLSKLDVSKLTALSREVISRQATINIGTIGHVAHGKSTIVKAISGVQTVRFKNELERNITIKLDTRAVEDSRGEQEDTVGNTSEMSSTRAKRPPSPGINQLSTKQPRHEQKFDSSSNDSQDDDKSTKIISDNDSFAQEVEKTLRNTRKSTSPEASVESPRLSKLSNGNNCSAKENGDGGIENLCFKYNLGDVKLKKLRIILEDINTGGKPGRPKRPSNRKLWEVERIIRCDERNGVLSYLIKWKNWGSEHNTWEPASNLINCQDILDDFDRERRLLLKRYTDTAGFHPNSQDVEDFLNQLKLTGESLANVSVKWSKMHSGMRNYFKKGWSKRYILEKRINSHIVRMHVCELRTKQLKSLKEWETDMNNITKGKPIILVQNTVDLESAPHNFFYIEEYLPGTGVIIPDDPPIGCECTNCNTKSNCCFSQYGGYCPYTITCKIRVPPGTPIFECNKRCTCDMNCVNRVVQRGAEMSLCIFRTNNGRGWGVKTLSPIKKGTFVTQYVGEVITNEEAEKRGKEYDAAGRTYLFDLDYNETEDQCPYTVDAAVYGNVSHFINHSCDPNLAVYGVWINCLDPNLPKLALFATRDIKKFEEITFDYMCQSSKNNDNSIRRAKNDLNADITAESEKKFDRPETPESFNNKTLCRCGAESCRRFLF